MDFNSVLLHPYQKEKFGCLDTHRGKYQVKIKAEIGIMHWQVKKGQRLPENHQSLGKKQRTLLPHNLQKEQTLFLILDFQLTELWDGTFLSFNYQFLVLCYRHPRKLIYPLTHKNSE